MRNVVDFLRKLEINNNREWFNENKGEYKAVLAEFEDFAAQLIEGISSFDETVSGLTVKDCTYRIYRDTRFSNDKTPYKTHMGVYVCKGGKKSGNAGYYFHVEPTQENYLGGNMLSAGSYMPEPVVLRSIREDIAYNGEEFARTVKEAEKKGFRIGNSDKLKRVPLGFPADSPYAEYLKMKHVDVEMTLSDDDILASGLLERIVDIFSGAGDFVKHLNRAVDYARQEMMK